MNKIKLQGFLGIGLLIVCMGFIFYSALKKNEPKSLSTISKTRLPALAGKLGDAFAPKDYEVHYLDTHEGIYRNNDCQHYSDRCTVEVNIKKLDRPLILVMTAYEPIHWSIKKDPGTILKQVILSGYYEQTVSGISADTPVQNISRTFNNHYFYGGYIQNEAEYLSLSRKIKRLTGKDPETVQSVYRAKSFTVDGKINDLLGSEDYADSVNKFTQQLQQTAVSELNWQPYIADMQRRIRQNWHPPSTSKQEHKHAVVMLKIDRSGRLLSVKITQSFVSPVADEAALAAIKAAAPFRPLPLEFKGKSIDVQFTFDYMVNTRR